MKPLPNQSATRCVMCGAPVPRHRNPPSALCGSLVCEARHRAIPAERRCSVCTRPLSIAQWASAVCDDPACRHEQFVGRRLAADMAAQRALHAAGLRRRDRAASQQGIPDEERASYRLAILPYNRARVSQLPAQRRAVFAAHLRANLANARELSAAGERYVAPADEVSAPPNATSDNDATSTRSASHRDAEQALLGAGCAACRGRCCMEGEDHAFNRSNTMLRYLGEYPDHDDDTIVSRYLSYLGERTITRGCVYQGETGCTLPRDLRADICNSFHCSGLKMLRDHYTASDPVRAFVIRHKGTRVIAGRFLDTGPADAPAAVAKASEHR